MLSILTSFFGLVKHLMDGAKLPNWAKLSVVFAIIALLAFLNHTSIGQIADISAAIQARETRRALAVLRRDNVEILEALQDKASDDSIRYGRVERKLAVVQRRLDRNEEAVEEANEGLDMVLRKLDRIERRR